MLDDGDGTVVVETKASGGVPYCQGCFWVETLLLRGSWDRGEILGVRLTWLRDFSNGKESWEDGVA